MGQVKSPGITAYVRNRTGQSIPGTFSSCRRSLMNQLVYRSCFLSLALGFVLGCDQPNATSDQAKPTADQHPSTATVNNDKEHAIRNMDDNPKSNRQTTDVIDLALHTKSLADYLKGSIARFAKEHPDVEVSCIAFYFT